MDVCVMDDFDKICRICMELDKTFLPIVSFKIIDMIITCASVQIWENDDLPNQICQACFLQLQNTVNFKQLCENSDNTFRQIIKQNKLNLSNNQSDISVKDEELEDYLDNNSSIDIKEEDFEENATNEKTLENVKCRVGYNEDNCDKSDTNNFLDIKNKDGSMLKSEEENDTCENTKDDKNVIETFTCDKCGKEFKKVWVLGQHMHSKHRAKALKCDKCKLKFYHPLHLNRHQELMHNQLNLTCNICNKVLINIYKLKRHKLTHSNQRLGQRLIPCQRCDKSFKDKQTLKFHNKEVHSHIEKYVACHICGKSVTIRHLQYHLVTHQERDQMTCHICSKIFISQITLKTHIKNVHETQIPKRNHLCNICGHAMRTAPQLRTHLLIHTNERPYACDRCDKAFRRSDHLKDHILGTHLNQRKFQCTFCPQAFNYKKTLMHHERRHTGEKPHKCEACGKGFIQKMSLKIHMKTHSNSKENLMLISI